MINIKQIIDVVCLTYDISHFEMLRDDRSAHVLLPRQIAIYIANTLTDFSSEELGRQFKRDRTSIAYSITQLRTKMAEDRHLKEQVSALTQTIEWRAAHQDYVNIDVLDVARHVVQRPLRNAMSLSIVQISALAETLLQVWEVAQAGDYLAQRELTAIHQNSEDAKEWKKTSNSIARSITDQMALMCADQPEENAQ